MKWPRRRSICASRSLDGRLPRDWVSAWFPKQTKSPNEEVRMSQMTNTSMNFLPEDYVEKRQAARTAVICVGLLVVVVTGIVATWWYKEHYEAKAVYDYEARVNAQFEEANKQIQEVQEIDR